MSSEVLRSEVQALADALPTLVFVSDAAGLNTFTNHTYQSYCGCSADDLRGSAWLDVLHPDDRARADTIWRQAVSAGRSYEAEYRFRRADGLYRWHLCRGQPVRNDEGVITAWVGTCTDVEDHRRTESNLRELLETLPVGVLLAHDTECQWVTGNSAAEALLRSPRGGNLSRSARAEGPESFRVLRDGLEVAASELPMQRAAGRGEPTEQQPLDIQFADGSIVHVLVSARPLLDPGGERRGAVATILDVSAITAAEAALRLADRRKDEFIAILSHELRNPMASLQSGLDLLGYAELEAGVARSRNMMERQLTQLVRIVDDLLDVSRISRGEIRLELEVLDLNDVLDDALESTAQLLIGYEVHVERAGQPLRVYGDRVRLSQVIANLLSNAAIYNEPGGSVWLQTGANGDRAEIAVRDSGIGIAADRQLEVFEMFARLPDAAQIPTPRLGVGLAFARHLVDMHGGTIAVESEGPGQGSEFTVRLPLANHRRRQAKRTQKPTTAPAPLTILVVDDNSDGASALSMLLELEGHEVRVAGDGTSALQILASFQPQVVLLDIGMPGMNGYEVARAIRRLPGGHLLRIVAITGWGRERDRARAAEAGIDEHITKPVGVETLKRLFHSVRAEPE